MTSTGSVNNKPVVFLMGATACGKTDLSLKLAHEMDAEIVSVDSALVYRGLDIGTAKPSKSERQKIPHHLIDVIDPWQSYSAAMFCKQANELILRIHERGKRALLVGGTMLYFKALEQGLAILPEADANTRQVLTEQASQAGWAAMHKKLQGVDPQAAMRIHPNDPQRIMRALEVYTLTGQPLSALQARTQSTLTVPVVKFALAPTDRSWLHERIERRFNNMIDQGFLDEVQRFYDHPKITVEHPAMRSVGYRQAWQFISGEKRDEQWGQRAIAATRQLAKRQLTWLRGMSHVRTISCDTLSLADQTSVILNAQEPRF